MNLGDPELEMIDPTPNVQALFVHFDKTFFKTSLISRTVVRWSKRMYSCAGVCSYEGYSGVCDIALSEPLLKLRPRKDLVETLLHEMIHAYLFVTDKDQDRDGHGRNFQEHMFRINKAAGLNITIYHSFHNEVQIYQTHWWRCNGPCQTRRPHFGIVRRAMNRAPGPNDYWWNDHKMRCGGTFIKIKEPVKGKKAVKEQKDEWLISNRNDELGKYIPTTNKIMQRVPNIAKSTTPVLKDTSNVIANVIRKKPSNVVVINKTVRTVPKAVAKPAPVNTGSGNTDVSETVRNIWANKNIPGSLPVLKKPVNNNTGYKEPVRGITNPKKHKTTTDLQTPPTKMKKIEDYFNATTVLKDLYGDDYEIAQSNNNSKLVAVNLKVELVICPVCNGKFPKEQINTHLDECLNKDLIEILTKDGGAGDVHESPPNFKLPDHNVHKPKWKGITPPPAHPTAAVKPTPDINSNAVDLTNKNQDPSKINTAKQETDESTPRRHSVIPSIPVLKPISPNPECSNNNFIDLTNLNVDNNETNVVNKGKGKTESRATSERIKIETVTSLVEEIDEALKVSSNLSNNKKRRNTDGFVQTNRGDHLPSGVENKATEAKAGPSSGEVFGKICPCCGKEFGDGEVEEHLDECLMFFDSNATIPEEGANRSMNTTILIEDDDRFDESQIFNDTGTKTPCPVCLKMVEQDDMNLHLDWCLQS